MSVSQKCGTLIFLCVQKKMYREVHEVDDVYKNRNEEEWSGEEM